MFVLRFLFLLPLPPFFLSRLVDPKRPLEPRDFVGHFPSGAPPLSALIIGPYDPEGDFNIAQKNYHELAYQQEQRLAMDMFEFYKGKKIEYLYHNGIQAAGRQLLLGNVGNLSNDAMIQRERLLRDLQHGGILGNTLQHQYLLELDAGVVLTGFPVCSPLSDGFIAGLLNNRDHNLAASMEPMVRGMIRAQQLRDVKIVHLDLHNCVHDSKFLFNPNNHFSSDEEMHASVLLRRLWNAHYPYIIACGLDQIKALRKHHGLFSPPNTKITNVGDLFGLPPSEVIMWNRSTVFHVRHPSEQIVGDAAYLASQEIETIMDIISHILVRDLRGVETRVNQHIVSSIQSASSASSSTSSSSGLLGM